MFAGIGCSWNNTDSTCNVAFYTCSDYTTWNTCSRGAADNQTACNALSPDCAWSDLISVCTNNVNSATPVINDCEYGACYAQMICSGALLDDNTTSESICDHRDKAVTPADGIYGAWKGLECNNNNLSNGGTLLGGNAFFIFVIFFTTLVSFGTQL